MHEFSIAESVVAIVRRHADGRSVSRVELKIGHLRQVVLPALEFAFGLVAQGTEAEGAELAVEAVPAAGRCRACGSRTLIDRFPMRCGNCAGLDLVVTDGEELLVAALEVEEAAPATAADPERGRRDSVEGTQPA